MSTRTLPERPPHAPEVGLARRLLRWGVFLILLAVFLFAFFQVGYQLEQGAAPPPALNIGEIAALITSIAGLVTAVTGLITVMKANKRDREE